MKNNTNIVPSMGVYLHVAVHKRAWPVNIMALFTATVGRSQQIHLGVVETITW